MKHSVLESMELDFESEEPAAGFGEGDAGDEIAFDEFEAVDDGAVFEDEWPSDEEIRRFRPPVSRRPVRSRSGVGSGLIRRRPMRPRFPRPRRQRSFPPAGRRRVFIRGSAPYRCPMPASEYVRWVQSSLNQTLGLNLAVTGVMNSETRNALRRFQQQRGILADGIAGPETKQALIAAKGAQPGQLAEPSPQGGGSAELDLMPQEEGEEFIGSLWPIRPRFHIEDRTHLTPKDKRKKTRREKDVYALVLHQTAFSRGNDSARYDSVTAHYVILPNGRILQLHPVSAYLWASNGFNARSVAVEFVGNFPSIRKRCWKPERYGCHTLSQEQIGAGRFLVDHLIRTVGLTHVLAHRQSSGTRENDPGPDIWCQVGEWAIKERGMRDGGAGFKVGTGKPIPDAWRNWCDAATRPGERQELVQAELEREVEADSNPEFSHGREAEQLHQQEEDAIGFESEELPNPDPKTIFSVWAPLVTLRLQTKSPNSPTTKSVTCFINKLLRNWSGTDSRYINRDRAQRIMYNNWANFDSVGQVDSVKSNLLHAAKWSKDPEQFYHRVVDIDYAVRNGLARIKALYNVHGDSNAAAKQMNTWAMTRQATAKSILSCYV